MVPTISLLDTFKVDRFPEKASTAGIEPLRRLKATLREAREPGYPAGAVDKFPVSKLLLASMRMREFEPHDCGNEPVKRLSNRSTYCNDWRDSQLDGNEPVK